MAVKIKYRVRPKHIGNYTFLDGKKVVLTEKLSQNKLKVLYNTICRKQIEQFYV